MTITSETNPIHNNATLYSVLTFFVMLVFSAVFLFLNTANYNWLSPQYEKTSSPMLWGIIQRLWLIIPIVIISILRPRQVGFRLGKLFQYWKMLLVMLLLNVAVVGGYTLLSGSTPYSGINMIINEAITVPLVEEIVWRGIAFAILCAVISKFLPENQANILAAIYIGVCFGLLHANNAFFGYPPAFVALQVLNATVWGVVYGIARAKTGSIYPSLLMHAAMNLAVALA